MITALQVPGWEQIPGLCHGFLQRNGGVSAPPFATLNFSYQVGDDPVAVETNWHRLKGSLNLDGLPVVTMRQVHGDRVLTLKAPAPKEAGEGDAMVTRDPGVLLGVLTADCVPILLVDPVTRTAAAVHAGWRGTFLGIAVTVVRLLEGRLGVRAENLMAALGPSIGGCCYEIETEIFQRIRERWGAAAEPAWAGKGVRGTLDLRLLITRQLREEGLPETSVFQAGGCTACGADFFSYRRDRTVTGRQLSFVGWRS